MLDPGLTPDMWGTRGIAYRVVHHAPHIDKGVCMRDLADMRIYTHIWELLLMRRHGFVLFKLKIVSERPITEAKEAVSTS